uniref:ER membrane protein complex subunit 2 n=1 Tax=Talaromyces marneffei PM1 TaxID=1077442 RepID=A0A093V5W2_TALMA
MATIKVDIERGQQLSNPAAALHLSQQASTLLTKPYSLSTLPFVASENPEQWIEYEQLFLVCLRTGDDKSAHLCLDRLTERFGPANERIMGLRGLYQEATAKDPSALEVILKEYNKILAGNAVNVPILKRRIALLRSMNKNDEAVSALVDYLEAFPTDAEAWCELGDLYQSNAMSAQAIFSLEEALLITPNSWNLHARLGEILYISTMSADRSISTTQTLSRSVKHFLRSLELCDDYVRGLYGLIMIQSGAEASADFEVPSVKTLEELRSMAIQKAEKLIQSQQSVTHQPDGLVSLKELVQQK